MRSVTREKVYGRSFQHLFFWTIIFHQQIKEVMSLLDRIRWILADTPLAPHIAVGRRGEDIAAQFLRQNGYRILDRNVRVGTKDEIDIIAFDPVDRVYVFAEVKTRKKDDPDFHPDLNITMEKRMRMARAARRYAIHLDEETGYRLDVLCVADGKVIEHYPEIAWSEE